MKQPYFYIIKHKPSGRFYAGAKWAKDADSTKLMKEHGYKTSSNLVKRLIKEDGLDSFVIIDLIHHDELKIPFGCTSVEEYESWFISSNDIVSNESWINANNKRLAHGSKQYKLAMMKIYGVEHPSQSNEIRQKVKNTLLNNYGVEHPLQSPDIKKRMQESVKRRLLKEGKKSFLTPDNLVSMSVKGKQRAADPNYIKMISEKTKAAMSNPDVLAKMRKPKSKLPEKKICPHCNKSVDPGNAKQYHFDNCKVMYNV